LAIGHISLVFQQEMRDDEFFGDEMKSEPQFKIRRRKNIGSSIDDFLKEEGVFEQARSQAIKEVVAWQLAKAMKKNSRTKKMAARRRSSGGEF
jgi:hypothetical protein